MFSDIFPGKKNYLRAHICIFSFRYVIFKDFSFVPQFGASHI